MSSPGESGSTSARPRRSCRRPGATDARSAYISSLTDSVMASMNIGGKRKRFASQTPRKRAKTARKPAAASVTRSPGAVNGVGAVSNGAGVVAGKTDNSCMDCVVMVNKLAPAGTGEAAERPAGKTNVPASITPAVSSVRKRPAKRPQSVWGSGLPPEILSMVFSYLTAVEGVVRASARLSPVCRLWRDVCLTPSLWARIDLSRVPVSRRSKKRLTWLFNHRLHRVQQLSLEGWGKVVLDPMLTRMTTQCSRLRTLDLTGCCRFSCELLVPLAQQCRHLSSLKLVRLQPRNCRPEFGQAIQRLCQLLGPRLLQLNFSDNMVSGLKRVMNAITDFCVNLELLDFSSVQYSGGGVLRLDIERLQRGCPRLRVLRWAHTSLAITAPTRGTQMPGFSCLEEFSGATMLREVDGGLSDAALARVLHGATQLRLLDVRGCRLLTAAALRALATARLQCVYLAGCQMTRQRELAAVLADRWRHTLTELDVGWSCERDAVTAVCEALGGGATALSYVLLRGAAVTPAAVVRLLDGCPKLRCVDLSSCRDIPLGVKRCHIHMAALRRRLLRPDDDEGGQ